MPAWVNAWLKHVNEKLKSVEGASNKPTFVKVKNRNIVLITCLFACMLIGIVLIQAWWIGRSLQLNEQAFDAAVYRSLEGVVTQTAEKENLSFIKRDYSGDTIIKTAKKMKAIRHPSSKKMVYAAASNVIKINVDNDSGKKTKTIIRIEKDNNGTKTIENSIIIGSGERVEIPEPPVPPESPEFIPEEKIEDIEVLIKKMTHIKNPDSLSSKPADIQKIIGTQVKQNNLPEVFAFALLNKKGDFIYKSDLFKDTSLAYKVNLYPNDLFGRDIKLALFFPGKTAHIKGDTWWVFILSLVFTTAILLLFIQSIRMLIRHKNLLEAKNDFINHMSHELKTPLATISLGADMLLGKTDKMDGEQIKKVASSIKKQGARLHEDMTQILMNAMLDNYHTKNEIFDLIAIFRQSLDEMQLVLEEKKASINTHYKPEQIFIKGDAALWRKVFSNLLDNALKFAKEIPEIQVSISEINRYVKIEIADKGIGIAQKDLEHVFEKFYRADYYHKSNIQGFGLGLNFVQKVVQVHKGTIKASSQLGQGTVFIIEMPHE